MLWLLAFGLEELLSLLTLELVVLIVVQVSAP
jgi:hypothetical protein